MKTYNIRGAIATRAAQIAAGAIKSKFRSGGGRRVDFRISDHRDSIAAIAASEEIVARATRDIDRWRKNRSANTAQKNGSVFPTVKGAKL